jgi:RNA polymerase sigma-70 factor (ECF subfamily)
MDEATLIAAARLGDEDAFAELYRQHIGYVRTVGRSMLRKDDLDDMCQDTFLLAFTRLHSFEGTCQFRTWIARIATTQCLRTLRKVRQASNGESNLIQINPELAADDFAAEDKNLEAVPARLDLDRLLRALQPLQRRVLEMAYVEGMPEAEIAEMLGTSPSSVKGTIHHARRRVQKKYKEI